MTLRQADGRAEGVCPRTDPRLELIQRKHELARALEAARLLQERLELAGLVGHAITAHRIRDDLARRLAELGGEPGAPIG